jgi:hypothetical protein
MPGVTRFHQQLMDYVEPQGVTVTRTTKGLLFRFPNGETEMLHFTNSDWRATRNTRANFRRNGIQWPGDFGDKKRPSTTAGTVKKVEAYLATLPAGEHVSSSHVAAGANVSFPAVAGAMVKLGWWKESTERLAKWAPPIENPTEVVEEVTEPDAEPTPTPSAHYREFLDTVDSWVTELEDIEGGMTVQQLLSTCRAMGLAVELRVWRVDSQTPGRG